MDVDITSNLREILVLLTTNPLKAADLIDGMAYRLHDQAKAIRQAVCEGRDPRINPGGMGDVVKMQVIGPDGDLKQSVDTSRN